MIFCDILDDYILYHKSLCHTDKTIRCYVEVLNIFNSVVNIVDYRDLSFDDIKKYQRYLNSKNLSVSSIGSYLRHIKAFVHWMGDNGYIKEKDLYKKIKLPKTPKKNVKIYTDGEIKQIFECVETEEPWITVRNKLIICLMLDSGLRREEVCKIKNTDINYSDSLLNVHGKGNKDRIVPIGNLTVFYMEKYKRLCPFESEYLLVDRRGNDISYNAIKMFMSKTQKKLKFEFSSHRLRHNFATNFVIDHYKKFGYFDSYSLMIILGHEEIKTTERYLHYARQIIASMERASHLDSIFFD